MQRSMVAVVTAGLLLVTGCSAPAMSTADSCREFNALGASIADPASMTKEAREKVAGKFADLAASSSDAMKDDVQTTADYIKSAVEGTNDVPPSAFSSAAKRIRAVCNTAR